MSHYPVDVSDKTYSIHGHLHDKEGTKINMINVCVDSELAALLNKPFGTPITLSELIAQVQLREQRIKKEIR